MENRVDQMEQVRVIHMCSRLGMAVLAGCLPRSAEKSRWFLVTVRYCTWIVEEMNVLNYDMQMWTAVLHLDDTGVFIRVEAVERSSFFRLSCRGAPHYYSTI